MVVSHDVPEVESNADYAYIVADQRVEAQGGSAELSGNSDPRVRQFLDGIADGPLPYAVRRAYLGTPGIGCG